MVKDIVTLHQKKSLKSIFGIKKSELKEIGKKLGGWNRGDNK